MKIKYVLALALILLLLCPVGPASAADEKARGADTLTIYLENDFFGFDNWDRYYTHGTKISWISQDLTNYRDILSVPSFVHHWIEQIPYLNDPQNLRTVSLSLGQNIYTPADRERTDLILHDRPYAVSHTWDWACTAETVCTWILSNLISALSDAIPMPRIPREYFTSGRAHYSRKGGIISFTMNPS